MACLPRGWGGVRDWMSVGKKTHVIGTKNVFLFLFAKKKTTKKKGKREIFYDPNNVFSTPNTKARRTTNQNTTTTGQKRERTTTFRKFFRKPLSRPTRDDIGRPASSSSRAFFLVGEIFQFRIGSRVKSKKEEQRGERRRDGQRSSRASTREGALRFPVFLRFVVGSHRRGRSPVPRIRPPRDFFEMPCENVLCNQSIGSPKRIQKKRRL